MKNAFQPLSRPGASAPIRLLSALVCVLACHGPSQGQGAPKLRIVSFGDSTTATRAKVDRVYSDRLPELLGGKAEVFNAGIPGDTTRGAAGRFVADVLDMEPDIVVIQFGLNDSAIDVNKGKKTPRVPPDEYERHLRKFVTTLKKKDIGVVLMTPNPAIWNSGLRKRYGKPPYDVRDPWGFNLLNKDYAASVRSIAEEEGVPLVDVFAAIQKMGVPGARTLLLDAMHPNDKGHEWLARQICAMIRNNRRASRKKTVRLQPRGYSLPVIDLAAEKHRQVIVDREKRQYLGHPTTVLLDDHKTMICVYPKGHGRGAIVMKRSTDAGLTWSERLPTPASWKTSKEVPTIYPVVDKQGKKRLIMFSGLHPIRMAVSEDDGKTWSELQKIGDFGGIVAMGCVIPLKNGDYMALFHDDGRFIEPKPRTGPRRFQVYKSFSTDGGLTWSHAEVITTHPVCHLCEPGFVRSPDGKELAVLFRENSRRRNGHVIFSRDEGKTWTKPREMPGALTGDRHVARYAPDGRLFITFRDTTLISPTKGDWVAWVGTYDDIAKGNEGQYRVRLMANTHGLDCAYPGLELLPDGTFVTTTYGHWTKGEKPYIVSVRLKLVELDAKAAAMGKERR